MSDVNVSVVSGLEEAPSDGGTYARKDAAWVDLEEAANLQVNRGTAAEVAAYTPLAGEPVWEETTKNLFLGDGQTQGGILVGRRVLTSSAVQTTPITSGTYSTPIAVSLTGTGSAWRVFGAINLFGIDPTDADVELNLRPSGGTIKYGSVSIAAPAGSSFATQYRSASTSIAVGLNEAASVVIDYVVQLTASTWDFGLPLRRTAGTQAAYYANNSILYAERLL